jgi:hypothetical protein
VVYTALQGVSGWLLAVKLWNYFGQELFDEPCQCVGRRPPQSPRMLNFALQLMDLRNFPAGFPLPAAHEKPYFLLAHLLNAGRVPKNSRRNLRLFKGLEYC